MSFPSYPALDHFSSRVLCQCSTPTSCQKNVGGRGRLQQNHPSPPLPSADIYNTGISPPHLAAGNKVVSPCNSSSEESENSDEIVSWGRSKLDDGRRTRGDRGEGGGGASGGVSDRAGDTAERDGGEDEADQDIHAR